jgi:ketosteroid isomerase-like protein
MRRILVLAAIAACTLLAETASTIESTEKTWAAAVTKMDFGALDKLMSDDLVYVHSTGVVESKAEYLTKLKSGDQKYTHLDYSDLIVKMSGPNAAVVAAKIRMRGATKGVPFDNTLRIMHTWTKEKSGWRLLGHQTARLPQ